MVSASDTAVCGTDSKNLCDSCLKSYLPLYSMQCYVRGKMVHICTRCYQALCTLRVLSW